MQNTINLTPNQNASFDELQGEILELRAAIRRREHALADLALDMTRKLHPNEAEALLAAAIMRAHGISVPTGYAPNTRQLRDLIANKS